MHGTPLPHERLSAQLFEGDDFADYPDAVDPTDWNWWWTNGYTDLIPIVPPGAALSENSHIRKNKTDGKAPGIRYPSGQWSGLKDWQKHVATSQDLADWRAMGAGIGLRRGAAFALDIDALDEATADAIEAAAIEQLGPAPMRVGRWPKRALLYRADGPIDGGKLLFFDGPGGVSNQIEITAQVVVSGIHPVTRKQYEWRRLPVPLADLTPVSQASLNAFIDSQRVILPGARAANRARSTKASEGALSSEQAVMRAVFAQRNSWVPDFLPVVATGDTWRIPSRDLERDLEEDLCIYSDGAYDFGTERNQNSPIPLIREFGAIVDGKIEFGGCPIYGPREDLQYAVVAEAPDIRRPTEAQALTWLCGRLARCEWPAFPDGATWSNSIRTISQAAGLDWTALRNTDCIMRWFEPAIVPEGWGAEEIARYADLLPAMRALDPKTFKRLEFVWDLNGATGGRSVDQITAERSTAAETTSAETKTDLPEPIDLFGQGDPVRLAEFPTNALPAVIEDWARDVAERMGVQTAFTAAAALATIAGAIGSKFRIQPKARDTDWTEPAFLWIALIEDPGGKKSPVIAAATRSLSKADGEKQDADDKKVDEWKAKKSARKKDSPDPGAKPSVRRHVVEGFTMEALTDVLKDNPAGVLIRQDELTQLIGGLDAYKANKGSDRPQLLSLADGRETRVDRAGKGATYVPTWGAGVLGGIQPKKIAEMAHNLDADGLLQRFIPIMGDNRRRPGEDREPDALAIDAYYRLVRELADMTPVYPDPIKLSREAFAIWSPLAGRIEALASLPNLSAAWRGHLGKWPGFSNRILLVLHVVETWTSSNGLPDRVNVAAATASRAVKLVEWLLCHSIRFYEECVGAGEAVEDARWIAGHILSAGPQERVTRRDLGQARRELRSAPDKIARAMAYLDRMAWCTPDESERIDRFGVSRWQINPRVFELFGDRAEKERARRQDIVAQIAASAAERKRMSDGK